MLSLAASNIEEIGLYSAVRPAALMVVAALLCLSLLQAALRDWDQAALLTTIGWLLFFSYGHVYFGLVSQVSSGIFHRLGLIGSHPAIAVAWTAIFLLALISARRLKSTLNMVTRTLNFMGGVVLAFSLIQILRYEALLRQPYPLSTDGELPVAAQGQENPPDIYYIVLDGYARSDVLMDLFQLDNTPFLESLAELGFKVAEASHSNYVQTGLSLASSLNLSYLTDVADQVGERYGNRLPLARLIQHNRWVDFLSRQGYTIIAYSSGYRMTELSQADRFFRAPQRTVNPLEGLLLETSGFILLQEIGKGLGVDTYYPGYQSHRNQILFLLEELPRSTALRGPKFVFAHLVIPHPPFVFNSDGSPLEHDFRYSFRDGDAFLGTRQDYIQGYRGQVEFINQALVELLEELLSEAEKPPLIILQGDHGSGLQLSYESKQKTNLRERLSILNAYYFPPGGGESLYPEISPVNSFRLVANDWFGADLPLFEDLAYYSPWDRPYDFSPVEQRLLQP